MTHTITENGLTEYIEDERNTWLPYASSTSETSLKKLEFCMGHVAPIYRVTHGDRQIYVGALKETAVREYNALP